MRTYNLKDILVDYKHELDQHPNNLQMMDASLMTEALLRMMKANNILIPMKTYKG